jgi:hypothetical protein
MDWDGLIPNFDTTYLENERSSIRFHICRQYLTDSWTQSALDLFDQVARSQGPDCVDRNGPAAALNSYALHFELSHGAVDLTHITVLR